MPTLCNDNPEPDHIDAIRLECRQEYKRKQRQDACRFEYHAYHCGHERDRQNQLPQVELPAVSLHPLKFFKSRTSCGQLP